MYYIINKFLFEITYRWVYQMLVSIFESNYVNADNSISIELILF